jgi:hypothetical protein
MKSISRRNRFHLARLVTKIDKRAVIFRVLRRMYLNLADALDDTLTLKMPTQQDYLEMTKSSVALKKLHVVGNSHAHSFTGSKLGKFGKGSQELFNWDSFSLGPLSTIDLLGRKWSVFLKIIETQEIDKSDYFLFPFGETECRWYALKSTPPETLETLTDAELMDLINPYLKASFEIYSRVSDLGFNLIIWSGHISRALQPKQDLLIPVYGTAAIRNRMSLIWRNESKAFAEREGIKFLDFLSLQLNQSTEYLEEMLEDEVHINTKLLSGFLLAKIESDFPLGATQPNG